MSNKLISPLSLEALLKSSIKACVNALDSLNHIDIDVGIWMKPGAQYIKENYDYKNIDSLQKDIDEAEKLTDELNEKLGSIYDNIFDGYNDITDIDLEALEKNRNVREIINQISN